MTKLYSGSMKLSGAVEVTDRTIVDVLNTNDVRTSVSIPAEPGEILSRIVGINQVVQGEPRKLWDGSAERGLIDPDSGETVYLIDTERRILHVPQDRMDLLADADKVRDPDKYIWDGSFQEILDAFQDAGYSIENT